MALPDFATTDDLADFRDGDPEALIRQVQAAIRAYCGWHIAPELEQTVVLDGDGSRHLWLPSLHVVSVSAASNAGTTLDVADDIDWSESGYVELRHGRWTSRPRQISVTMTHGYMEIPAELVELAVSLADRSGPTGGTTSEQAGQVRLTFGTFNGVSGGIALLAHEEAILSTYKLPPRA